MSSAVLAGVIAALGAHVEGAITTVAPFKDTAPANSINDYEATDGNANLGSYFQTTRTVQYLYSTAALDLPEGAKIEGMRLRLNVTATSSPAITYSGFSVQLAVAATTPSTFSDTFSTNIASGTDVMVRPAATLTFAAGAYPSSATGSEGATAEAWGPYIPFTNTFTYDDVNDGLVVTIRWHSGTDTSSTVVDAVHGFGHTGGDNNVRGQWNDTVGAYTALTANRGSATIDRRVAVIQFTYSIPEPASGLLLTSAGAMLLSRRRAC